MEQQQQEEESCVPPGFRFHPTEEELVGYYLARKVASQKIDLEIIQEVDLYRIEPWDLQERCKHGGGGGGGHEAEQSSAEWYFFSFKDRKYPSGTRTNRATAAGFWKATGRDKPVVSRSRVIGMRKTLVFYKGRAPNGRKTDWIMHEYRLQTNEHAPTQEEGWVVCRAFQKPVPNQRPFVFPTYAAPAGFYDARMHAPGDHHRFLDSHLAAGAGGFFPGHGQYLDDLESKKHLFSIPQLESPTTTAAQAAAAAAAGYVVAQNHEAIQQQGQSAIDWNFLDTLLSTSQLHDSSASSFHLH